MTNDKDNNQICKNCGKPKSDHYDGKYHGEKSDCPTSGINRGFEPSEPVKLRKDNNGEVGSFRDTVPAEKPQQSSQEPDEFDVFEKWLEENKYEPDYYSDRDKNGKPTKQTEKLIKVWRIRDIYHLFKPKLREEILNDLSKSPSAIEAGANKRAKLTKRKCISIYDMELVKAELQAAINKFKEEKKPEGKI